MLAAQTLFDSSVRELTLEELDAVSGGGKMQMDYYLPCGCLMESKDGGKTWTMYHSKNCQ